MSSHKEEGSGKRSRNPFLYIAIHNHDSYNEGRKSESVKKRYAAVQFK